LNICHGLKIWWFLLSSTRLKLTFWVILYDWKTTIIYIYVNIVYPCYNCGWLLFPMIKPLILPICDGEPRFFTQT
jgi:hypothetical protein